MYKASLAPLYSTCVVSGDIHKAAAPAWVLCAGAKRNVTVTCEFIELVVKA